MDNIKLNIKRIGAMDIGALREMSVDFAREENQSYPIIDDKEIDAHMLNVLSTKDHPDYIYLIAYAGKKPVGFFLGYIGGHEWSRPRRVFVGQELYVVPNKRGGKVGIRLMMKSLGIAFKLGVEGVECIGSYNNTDKKWEKFGFKPHMTYGHMPLDRMQVLMKKLMQDGDR